MGVDFVPAYRTGAAGVREITAVEPASAPPPAPPAPSAPPPEPVAARREAARPAAAPEVVVKVAAPRAEPSAAPPAGKDRAAAEKQLAALRARYEAEAPHKAFDTTFNQIVFGEGDAAARLCFVGEAPGEDEDRTGRPFVGRAGQLLEKMIIAMGLTRADVYICNVLKTRPPGNRTPTQDEVAACKPFLLEQLAIVRPEVVVGLGLSATHALLETVDAMSRLRGRWWSIRDAEGSEIPFMPTYHPAFLLRSYTDENRAKVWADLKMVMEKLGMGAVAAKK